MLSKQGMDESRTFNCLNIALSLCPLSYVLFNKRAGVLYRIYSRGEAEWFISDKARIASILNSFKNDPFYTHFVSVFAKEFSE